MAPITDWTRLGRGGAVRRGPVVATFVLARAYSSIRAGVQVTRQGGAWAVSEEGTAAGFAAESARLTVPAARPAHWRALEAVGSGDEAVGALMPWNGGVDFAASGAPVAFAADRRAVVVVVRGGARAPGIRVNGAGTALAMGDSVELFAIIG